MTDPLADQIAAALSKPYVGSVAGSLTLYERERDFAPHIATALRAALSEYRFGSAIYTQERAEATFVAALKGAP